MKDTPPHLKALEEIEKTSVPVVMLDGEAELRTRNRSRDFLFLGTIDHSVCCTSEGMKNDETVHRVHEDLLQHGEVKPDLLSSLEDLDPHPSTIS